MPNFRLLVVEDDSLVVDSLRATVSPTWEMIVTANPDELPIGPFNAAIVDMHFAPTAKRTGIEVITQLRHQDPHLEIIAMSGVIDRDLMEDCLKAGASRFLAKPLSGGEVFLTLEKIESFLLLRLASGRSRGSEWQWIGQGKESERVKRDIANLRGERGPILITGESGSGKEVAARLLHQQEGARPWIAVNVAAIPENLFESEIFGHVRGAFTGAEQNKIGLAEAAHHGDLFLDEVEALPLSVQPKILRFLETGEVRRVGGREAISVNVRIVTATNRDLKEMVEKGEFREDLYWRLSGKMIHLPPLRERADDIPLLCQHFLSQDKMRQKQLESDALPLLLQHSWPGNVRELRRFCEQLLVSAPLPLIRAVDVRAALRTNWAAPLTPPPGAVDFEAPPWDPGTSLHELLSRYERSILLQCREQIRDVDLAARALGISRSSLYKKIRDYSLEWRPS